MATCEGSLISFPAPWRGRPRPRSRGRIQAMSLEQLEALAGALLDFRRSET